MPAVTTPPGELKYIDTSFFGFSDSRKSSWAMITEAIWSSTGPVTKITRADTAAPAAAPVCSSCGVVESVRTVTHKGQAHGVGAVAGGVVGAVVGNQMGKGDGRKAMTVLGALGGGLAGNEIEKRSKTTTAHEVKVRMDDGTTRTFRRSQSMAVGTQVTVDGDTLSVTKKNSQAQ